MLRSLFIVGAALLAACHHGPRVVPAADPVADLAKARAQFRSGDYAKALVSFRRLTYALGPSQPEMAEARYHMAECYFQTGDRVQAAHEFRQVADQFATSEYAPLALLRAGDANLRLWRKPELDPSYGERRFAIRRIQLRFPPQPQVSIAGPQQGQGRVLTRRELVRDLAELVGRLNAVPRLEVTLGHMVSHLGHLRLAGAELVGEPAERHQRLGVVPAPELRARLRQVGDGVRRGHHSGPVVTGRQQRGTDDEQGAKHDPHGWFGGAGDGASALPRALIFSCARWVMVSPGVPPASACW